MEKPRFACRRVYRTIALGLLCLFPAIAWLPLAKTGLPSNIAPVLLLLIGLCCATGLLYSSILLARRYRSLYRKQLRLTRENATLRRDCLLSQRRCHHLLDHAGDAIFFIDPQTGALLEINRQAENLLGYQACEIQDLPLESLFPGRQKRRYLRLVRRVLKQGSGKEPNLIFRRKNGTTFYGAVHARLGDLGDDQVVHGVLRDISDIKQIEKELRQKNRDLALLNHIAHQVSETSDIKQTLNLILDQVVQNVSASGGGIYLLRHGGTDLHLLNHQGISATVLKELRRIAPGQGIIGQVAANRQLYASPDLQHAPESISPAVSETGWQGFCAVPLIANDRPAGVLFLFTCNRRIFSSEERGLLLAIGKQLGAAVLSAELFDSLNWQYRLTQASNRELEISRRQLHANLENLARANRVLEQQERIKNNFLTLASHELRTPLTYIMSGTELLSFTLGGRLTDEENRVLAAIREGGDRLHDIVQTLLEIARIESRAIYLEQEEVPFDAIFENLAQRYRPLLEPRSLRFSIAPFPKTCAFRGDTLQLIKVFEHLLENAFKFTPAGGEVAVRASLNTPEQIDSMKQLLDHFSPSFFEQTAAGGYLRITIRDTGVGIDPEEQVRIFDKFYEIGDSSRHFTSRTRFGGKGVGLGLALVKGIVEAHGGMVWVDSPGTSPQATGGSAFHILLPLQQDTEENQDVSDQGLSGHPPA